MGFGIIEIEQFLQNPNLNLFQEFGSGDKR